MLDEAIPQMSVEEFRLIRDLIHEHCGIFFQDDGQQLLERRLGPRLTARGLQDWGEYYRFLRYHTSRKEELEEAKGEADRFERERRALPPREHDVDEDEENEEGRVDPNRNPRDLRELPGPTHETWSAALLMPRSA